MNTISLDNLTDTLRRYPILSAAQLDEVTGTLSAQFPEPQALLRELLKRGWLTNFQAKQLLHGRGPQLIFGPYLVLDPLGGGGMGQVFKVRHQAMGRIVGLKVLRKELMADEAAVGRFYREVEVISQLDHPNLVHAYDADVLNAVYFLALEYIEGVDLEKMVGQGGPLPLMQACDYIRQAALGLQYAHEKGLVHRDIKPANLVVAQTKTGDSRVTAVSRTATSQIGATPWGVLKVLDMGLARLSQPAADSKTRNLTTLAGNQVMLGTPDYMAPEQAIDFHRADIRADIYSLGCTFFFLLAGKPPFAGGSAPMKLIRHQQADPPPIEQLRPEVPPELAAVVAKMLVKRLPERYQTPGEVADVLAGLMQTPNLLPPAPPSKPAAKKDEAPTRSSSPSIRLPALPKSTGLEEAVPSRASSARISLPPQPKPPVEEEADATVDEQLVGAAAETDVAEPEKETDKKPAAAEKAKGRRRKSAPIWRHWKGLAGAAGAVFLVGFTLVFLTGGDKEGADAKATGRTPSREPANVAYLTEMPERDVSIGWGELGKHGRLNYPNNKNGLITVKGVVSAHGLSTHPPANGSARVAYDLGKKFRTFRTGVALNDDVTTNSTPLTFKVHGDGKLLWESKPVKTSGAVQDCSVSVQGIDRLQLEVVCPGEYGGAHAVWVEPELLR